VVLYDSAEGKEFFIEKIDAEQKCLGFIRLRFPSYFFDKKSKPLFSVLKDSAIIRELHIYGKAMEIGENDKKATQHKGLGEELLIRAEEIAEKEGIKSSQLFLASEYETITENLDTNLPIHTWLNQSLITSH